MHRHVELVAIRIFQVQEFATRTTSDERDQSPVTPDTIFFVNHG